MDLSRLPTGDAGWIALIDHALALGDLSEVTCFELKGLLSFAQKPARKRSAVTVARPVLGLANRMPDSAARHLGGHGVVLVGVQDQSVVGAELVDAAVLHDVLQLYLGNDGPSWDHRYIDHPDGLVLAIVVDPPQWGDRIYTCCKEYAADDGTLAVRDGDIFVRVPGKTQRATSNDIANLQRRRDRSPAIDAKIDVEYDGDFDRIDFSSAVACIRGTVDEIQESLLAGLPNPDQQLAVRDIPRLESLLSIVQNERRTQLEFRREVEAWRKESYGVAEQVATELIRHELARGYWRIRNESNRYLENVQVQIQFPPDVGVLLASETDYCDPGDPFNARAWLPDSPQEWGSQRFVPRVPGLEQLQPSPASILGPEFEVEETDQGTCVTWYLGDLRPGTLLRGRELFAVFTEQHAEVIDVGWSVTARDVNQVFKGQLCITCAQEPARYLTWAG